MRRPRSWTIGPLASPLLRGPATWSTLRPLTKAAGSPAFIASHPYVVDKVMKMILATSTRGYIGCGRALQKLDHKHHLGRIECPTLFVCGAQDGAARRHAGDDGLVAGVANELVDP